MSKIEFLPQDKVKDVLITRTAIKTLTSEKIVEKIVSFQFKDIRDATKEVNSIEISGFGRLLVSQAKIRRKKTTLLRIKESIEAIIARGVEEEKLKVYNDKLASINKNLEHLEKKTRDED